jgi:hypothetical protein
MLYEVSPCLLVCSCVWVCLCLPRRVRLRGSSDNGQIRSKRGPNVMAAGMPRRDRCTHVCTRNLSSSLRCVSFICVVPSLCGAGQACLRPAGLRLRLRLPAARCSQKASRGGRGEREREQGTKGGTRKREEGSLCPLAHLGPIPASKMAQCPPCLRACERFRNPTGRQAMTTPTTHVHVSAASPTAPTFADAPSAANTALSRGTSSRVRKIVVSVCLPAAQHRHSTAPGCSVAKCPLQEGSRSERGWPATFCGAAVCTCPTAAHSLHACL